MSDATAAARAEHAEAQAAAAPAAAAGGRERPRPMPRIFRQLLANTLVAGVTGTFLWFALTFWVYLETRSVVATGVIGGAFSISSAVLGPFFGTYVDRHRKHRALVATNVVSVVCFSLATAIFVAVGTDTLLRLSSPWFWLLVGTTLLGSVSVGMRGIVLVDVRHAARAARRPCPRERHGRDGHGRLVRDHIGVQRPRDRRPRDGLGVRRVARAHRRVARARTEPAVRRARARARSERRARSSTYAARSTRSAPCPASRC
ncbi:MAG: hypothetical protein KatS3mg010_1409 [Acidimicrobiia bacterium]|nr:MAG: hypothetical protein KatS3mg010_1409 [Acidimicrobiia bacterium]